MKQPEALRLAKMLQEESQDNPDDYRWQAGQEIERLHEANQAMLEALKKARAELAGLPRSLGYEFDHIKAIDAAIAEGETK